MKKLLIFIVLLCFPYITNACTGDGSIDFKIYGTILVVLLLIHSFSFLFLIGFSKFKKNTKYITYLISIAITLRLSIFIYEWLFSHLLCT